MQLFLFEYSDAAAVLRLQRRRRGDGLARVHARPLQPPRRRRGRRRRAQQRARRRDGRGVERLVRRGPARPRGARDRHARPRGEIDLGEPSDAGPHATRCEAIDCPVGGLRRPRSACPGGARPARRLHARRLRPGRRRARGPRRRRDLGPDAVGPPPAARRALGSEADGSDAAEELITMGMRLAPPEPSMLDMRNAILQADTALNGGALHDVLWSAFAHRGMGYYASAFDGADAKPAEDFNVPPADGAPRARCAARCLDSQTGLPLAGALVASARRPTTRRRAADRHHRRRRPLRDRRHHRGHLRQARGAPGGGGYDPVDVPKLVVARRRDDDAGRRARPQLGVEAGRRVDRRRPTTTPASRSAGRTR